MASYSQPCARHLGPGFRQGPLWLDLRSLLTYSARRRLRTLLKKYVSYICLIHLRRPNALAETEGRCEQEAYCVVSDIVSDIVSDVVFDIVIRCSIRYSIRCSIRYEFYVFVIGGTLLLIPINYAEIIHRYYLSVGYIFSKLSFYINDPLAVASYSHRPSVSANVLGRPPATNTA